MIKINTPRPKRMGQESHPYETTVPSVWDKNPKRLRQKSQAFGTKHARGVLIAVSTPLAVIHDVKRRDYEPPPKELS